MRQAPDYDPSRPFSFFCAIGMACKASQDTTLAQIIESGRVKLARNQEDDSAATALKMKKPPCQGGLFESGSVITES